MSLPSEELRLFNLDTMSGVFAGTRPPDYRRLRLGSLADPTATLRWYELHLYTIPPSMTLYRHDPDPEKSPPAALCSISEPPRNRVVDSLQIELANQGLWLHACGSCHYWQQSPSIDFGQEPVGRCHWASEESVGRQLPMTLARQSPLSLGCTHWRKAKDPQQVSQLGHDLGSSTFSDRAEPCVAPQGTQSKTNLRDIWNGWRSRVRPIGDSRTQATDWNEHIQERSAGQAGTQACLVCPGRLVNLAALSIDTPDGDAQTLSVWRCRTCYTIFLNNWIDRWKRLDTLETEESYYRLAPREAFRILDLLDPAFAPDSQEGHSRRRQQHGAILQFINSQQPLGRQIKHGR